MDKRLADDRRELLELYVSSPARRGLIGEAIAAALAEIDWLRACLDELESSRPAAKIEWAIGRPLKSGGLSMRETLGVVPEAEARERLEARRRWFAGLGHPDDDRAWRAEIAAQMGLYWRPALPEPEPWRPAAPAGEGGPR